MGRGYPAANRPLLDWRSGQTHRDRQRESERSSRKLLVSAWDENAGRVTRSFSDWYLVDCDQRVFARKGLEFAKEVYDRVWDELARQPGDPDGPELPDLFHDAIDGLWPHDFEWMHLTGVVKDAVTNFEVYLERAADEI